MGFIKRMMGKKEEVDLPNPVATEAQMREQVYQQILRESAAANTQRKPSVMRRIGSAIAKAATSNTIVQNPGGYVHRQFRQNLGGRTKGGYYRQAISPQRAQALARLAGARIPGGQKRVNRGVNQGRRGRPKGTYDQRYARFGGVYGYRQWLSEQRARQRLQQQSQGAPQYQYQQMQIPQPVNVPEPFPRPYPTRPRPPEPQNPIMQTPGESMNVLKIKMNDMRGQPQNKMSSVFNPETPMGDPRGDYYTVPDFFSGQQILKRRTHDNLFKW